MKILFIAQHKWPHVGGVEQHLRAVSEQLIIKNVQVKTISGEDLKYPKIKYLGLLYIWKWIFINRKFIQDADIVHIHDVFIWYLPFRFLYPNKKVFTTFHGWEGKYPIPFMNKLQKQIASKLSKGTIAVGKYIEKYYGIKADKIIYGGTSLLYSNEVVKKRDSIVFVGRLEEDTGVLELLKLLDHKKNKWSKIDFIGDGSLRKESEKYGTVHGFCDPKPYLKKAEYVVPGGYLSYIEARQFGCKILVFPNNPLKKDYWNEIEKVKSFPTWGEIANIYLKLWKN